MAVLVYTTTRSGQEFLCTAQYLCILWPNNWIFQLFDYPIYIIFHSTLVDKLVKRNNKSTIIYMCMYIIYILILENN